MRKRFLFTGLVFLSLLMAACGSAREATGTLVPQVPTFIGTAIIPITGKGTATPEAPSTVDQVQNKSLGSILVDGNGMTLYLYIMDGTNSSTCYGSCAAVWPPFLTGGTPTAGSGVNASLLGTITRNDGSIQVTYNGHPLYYFARDRVPGDINGENVQDVWFAVTPQGNQR